MGEKEERREGRLIIGIGSCVCGGQEAPQPAGFKLKAQESRGVVQSDCRGLKTKGPVVSVVVWV